MSPALQTAALIERERAVASDPSPAQPRIGYANVVRMLAEEDLRPQAVFNISIDELGSRAATFVVKSSTDFDEFRGIGLKLANVPFAFINYRGHPEDTATLYMPGQIRNVGIITAFIRHVCKALKLPAEVISWERRDDPDL
jgi:hypothetical protein